MTNPQLDVFELGSRIGNAATAVEFTDLINDFRKIVPPHATERLDPEFDFLYEQVTDTNEPLLVGLVRTQIVNLGTVALLNLDSKTKLSTDILDFQKGTRDGGIPRYEARPYISRQLTDTTCNLLSSSSYSSFRGAKYIYEEGRVAKMITFRDNFTIRAAFFGHRIRHETITSNEAESLIAETAK